MFSACETYEKQLRIEKTRLSHQVWSHGGSTFKKKRTLNSHFSRPAETDPYAIDSNLFRNRGKCCKGYRSPFQTAHGYSVHSPIMEPH